MNITKGFLYSDCTVRLWKLRSRYDISPDASDGVWRLSNLQQLSRFQIRQLSSHNNLTLLLQARNLEVQSGMSSTKHYLVPLQVAGVSVRTSRTHTASCLSLQSFYCAEKMEYTPIKGPVVSMFSADLHSKFSELEVNDSTNMQFDGNFVQGNRAPYTRNWLARTSENNIWDSDSGKEIVMLKPWHQGSVMCKRESDCEGKRNPYCFLNIPCARTSQVLLFAETDNLQVPEKEMLELPEHTPWSTLRLLEFIFTSLILFIVCLFLWQFIVMSI